jgi:hypothetical protein
MKAMKPALRNLEAEAARTEDADRHAGGTTPALPRAWRGAIMIH